MPTRREFLGSAAALAVGLAGTAYGQEKEQKKPEEINTINGSLQEITQALTAKGVGASVETHYAENPTAGIVQWRWNHFREEMLDVAYPDVDIINDELFEAMKEVCAMPNGGLDALFMEGLIEGSTFRQIRECRRIHRELITRQLTTVVPFGGILGTAPSTREVDRNVWLPENQKKPVRQIVYPNYGGTRSVKVSPLGRLGAGFILSEMHKVDLLTSEDPEIARNAEQAELRGTPEENQKWVHAERDKHFIKLMLESRRKLSHLLVGYNHILTDDIAASGQPISHIVVSVKSLPDVIKRAKKHAEQARQTTAQ